MDREIRAQERHHQFELKKHKEAAAAAAELQKHATQVHTQLSQLQKPVPGTSAAATAAAPATSRSARDSLDKTDGKSRSSHHDLKHKGEALATTSASTSSAVRFSSFFAPICAWRFFWFWCWVEHVFLFRLVIFLQDPKSQGGHTSGIDTAAIAAGQSVPLAALATVAPILPFGVTTLRDDSTESDQSLVGSQPQAEAYQRFL